MHGNEVLAEHCRAGEQAEQPPLCTLTHCTLFRGGLLCHPLGEELKKTGTGQSYCQGADHDVGQTHLSAGEQVVIEARKGLFHAQPRLEAAENG